LSLREDTDSKECQDIEEDKSLELKAVSKIDSRKSKKDTHTEISGKRKTMEIMKCPHKN
jgi:hypothetical protein